jgi:hypothetical protein
MTNTATLSPTYTATSTATASPTSSTTATTTNTFANSATNTPTFTPSGTPTKTNSFTPTHTLTNTATMTPTSTVTPTATSTVVTVQASQGPTPPIDSTQNPGRAGVTVQQIQLTNPGSNSVTLGSLTLTEMGVPSVGITSVSLLQNGTVISTVTFNGTTAVFNLANATIAANNGAVTYQVTANFSNNAPAGNYQFSMTGGTGNNGQPVLFNGLPVNGAVITIAGTVTPSPTMTAASTPAGKPVVFPNPSNGGPVQVLPPAYRGLSGIKIQLFTIAFRKVKEQTYPPQAYGPVTVIPDDNWGNPLASGLYYLVITGDFGRSVTKLLILR